MMSKAEQHGQALWRQAAIAYGYVILWISLSAAVILYNKYILAYAGFPFPITLTMWHMAFCSMLAFVLVASGRVPAANMSMRTFLRAVVPISALYAGTLWLGNAAYLYLSVSFIQMLKALMPVAVFIVGCCFGTERFNVVTLGNMLVVSVGVAISAFGEINFVAMGVVLQLIAICTESTRLSLTQILLQKSGLKLNPITTLYYVAPCSLLFLAVPFFAIEAPTVINYVLSGATIPPWVLLTNAVVAFALNMAVFLLIGKTSALTMNIAGVVKDWMLIGLSVVLYKAPVTQLNLIGYLVAFAAVCFYNYQKIQGALQNSKSRGWGPLSAVDGKRVNVHANGSSTMPHVENEGLLDGKESNTADVQYVPALNTPTKLTPLKGGGPV